MMDSEFTIIGAGAGGLTSAHQLSKKFSKIDIFEEGGNYDLDDFKKNSITSILNKCWRNSGFTPIIGSPNIVFSEGIGVGGSTLINGGVITRPSSKLLKNWETEIGEENFDLEKILDYLDENEKLLSISKPVSFGNKDSDLLELNAKSLGFKVTDAMRAVINCQNTNRCAFGCTTGSKQSLDVSIIPIIKDKVQIYSNFKLHKVITNNKDYVEKIILKNTKDSSFLEKKVKNLILSSGAIQTPKILMKNNLIKKPHPLQFHLNVKIFAEFNFKINAENSTILTKHIREFENENVLMMTSNFNNSINAAGLSHFNTDLIEKFIQNNEKSAVFNLQFKPTFSHAKFIKFLNMSYLKWSLSDRDFDDVKKYLKELIKIIFISEPIKIYLPIIDSDPIKNSQEAFKIIDKISKRKLIMNSVHAMSTCSISRKIDRNFIRPDGRLSNYKNIYISDASILPSNITEHPQNTIMALSRNIISKNFF